jgi:hypothetical protein
LTVSGVRPKCPYAEVAEVFRRILAEGCALDQVEIACASDAYAPLVWEQACRHDWAVTLASGLPAALTRPGRALVALSAWIESDFAAGILRRLLHSGDVTLGETDLSPGRAAGVLAKAEAAWGRQTYALSLGRLAQRYRTRAADVDLPDGARTRLSRAFPDAASGTLRQIECSEEACEMSETEIPSRCRASKVRAAIPGTPSIPLPVTVTSACDEIADKAFTGYRARVRRPEISVPVSPGRSKGRTKIATRRATGIRARGWRTFEP